MKNAADQNDPKAPKTGLAAILEAVGVFESPKKTQEVVGRQAQRRAKAAKPAFAVFADPTVGDESSNRPVSKPSGVLKTISGLFANNIPTDRGPKMAGAAEKGVAGAPSNASIDQSADALVVPPEALLGSIQVPSLSPMRVFSPRPFEKGLFPSPPSPSKSTPKVTFPVVAPTTKSTPIDITKRNLPSSKPTMAAKRLQDMPKLDFLAGTTLALPRPLAASLLTTPALSEEGEEEEGLFSLNSNLWKKDRPKSLESVASGYSSCGKLIGETEYTPASSFRNGSPILQTFSWSDDGEEHGSEMIPLDAVPTLLSRSGTLGSKTAGGSEASNEAKSIFKTTTMSDYETIGPLATVL